MGSKLIAKAKLNSGQIMFDIYLDYFPEKAILGGFERVIKKWKNYEPSRSLKN